MAVKARKLQSSEIFFQLPVDSDLVEGNLKAPLAWKWFWVLKKSKRNAFFDIFSPIKLQIQVNTPAMFLTNCFKNRKMSTETMKEDVETDNFAEKRFSILRKVITNSNCWIIWTTKLQHLVTKLNFQSFTSFSRKTNSGIVTMVEGIQPVGKVGCWKSSVVIVVFRYFG